MLNNEDLTIYCSYHDPKLIWEYNLDYVPSYIKLFNTSDLFVKGDNINYLNKHLCEICTIYYVWKNNLYSKYIGFCHYRRFYNNLYKIPLNNNCIYYLNKYRNIKNFANNKKSLYQLYVLYEYLQQLNIWDKYKLYKIFFDTNTYIDFPWKISFILPWDKFIKVCEIYFGFLEYILGNYKCKDKYKNKDRYFAWASELWIGIIVSLVNEINPPEEVISHDKLSLLTVSNNVNDIILWIKKNSRTGSLTYYILTKLNNNDYNYIIENCGDSIPICFIKDKTKISNKYIELNINEYIKCLSAMNFEKGIYTIEKIN